MARTMRWRVPAVLLASAAVETALVGCVPWAWHGLLASGGDGLPVADRAGTVVSAASCWSRPPRGRTGAWPSCSPRAG